MWSHWIRFRREFWWDFFSERLKELNGFPITKITLLILKQRNGLLKFIDSSFVSLRMSWRFFFHKELFVSHIKRFFFSSKMHECPMWSTLSSYLFAPFRINKYALLMKLNWKVPVYYLISENIDFRHETIVFFFIE